MLKKKQNSQNSLNNTIELISEIHNSTDSKKFVSTMYSHIASGGTVVMMYGYRFSEKRLWYSNSLYNVE
jgi:hypothetical protein